MDVADEHVDVRVDAALVRDAAHDGRVRRRHVPDRHGLPGQREAPEVRLVVGLEVLGRLEQRLNRLAGRRHRVRVGRAPAA